MTPTKEGPWATQVWDELAAEGHRMAARYTPGADPPVVWTCADCGHRVELRPKGTFLDIRQKGVCACTPGGYAQ